MNSDRSIPIFQFLHVLNFNSSVYQNNPHNLFPSLVDQPGSHMWPDQVEWVRCQNYWFLDASNILYASPFGILLFYHINNFIDTVKKKVVLKWGFQFLKALCIYLLYNHISNSFWTMADMWLILLDQVTCGTIKQISWQKYWVLDLDKVK